MTRKLTDNLKNEIDSLFLDNEDGLITPQMVRDTLKDILDSLRPAYAMLRGNHSTAPLAFATQAATWTPIAGANIFLERYVSDELELTADQSNGAIETVFAGFNHKMDGGIVFTGVSNALYQFCFLTDGTPGPVAFEVDGAGSQRTVVATGSSLIAPPAGSTVQIGVRSPGGNSSIDIYLVRLLGELFTTRYA